MSKKQPAASRAPLSDEALEKLSPNDFARIKLTPDEISRLRAINDGKQQERVDRTRRVGIEEKPILAELREVEIDVNSVWDLLKRTVPYPAAIPILLKHLQLPHSDVVKDSLARALAVPEPEVRQAWPLLVDEYRKAPAGWGILVPGDTREHKLGAKDGLAVTLSVATTEETLAELIELAKDQSLGDSRVLLLSALKKRRKKNALVQEAVLELANDPDLHKEIASWR